MGFSQENQKEKSKSKLKLIHFIVKKKEKYQIVLIQFTIISKGDHFRFDL